MYILILNTTHVDILMISTEPLYHKELSPTEHDIEFINDFC
jgi:hypothetical protein